MAKLLGPRAGLTAFRSMLLGLPPGEARVRATAGAIECAARLDDDEQLELLIELWPDAGDCPAFERVSSSVRELSRRGRHAPAARLAAAEARRVPSPRALYLSGRCLAVVGDRAAADAFAGATRMGEREANAAVTRAARLGLVELLLRDPARHSDAATYAGGLGPETLPPGARLAVASAQLSAPGRYTRVAALDVLEELSQRAPPRVAHAAVARAARHADERTLTDIEIDRVRSVLRTLSTETATRVLARLDGRERDPDAVAQDADARWVLSASGEGREAVLPACPDDASARRRLGQASLSAVAAALRDDAAGLAAALGGARTALVEARRTEPVLWAAIAVGLGLPEEPRAAAVALAEEALGIEGAGPGFGYLRLAGALECAGAEGLAERALRRGTAVGEPGATEALASRLLGAAWQAWQMGDDAHALVLLEGSRPG